MAEAQKQNELFVEPDPHALAKAPVNRARKRAVRTRAPRPGPVTVTVHDLEKINPVAKGVALLIAGGDRRRCQVLTATENFTEVLVRNHLER